MHWLCLEIIAKMTVMNLVQIPKEASQSTFVDFQPVHIANHCNMCKVHNILPVLVCPYCWDDNTQNVTSRSMAIPHSHDEATSISINHSSKNQSIYTGRYMYFTTSHFIAVTNVYNFATVILYMHGSGGGYFTQEPGSEDGWVAS